MASKRRVRRAPIPRSPARKRKPHSRPVPPRPKGETERLVVDDEQRHGAQGREQGAPAGGTGGGKDGQHTEVGSRLHVTTTDSRTGQISLGDGGGHRLASWTSGYATARSEAICRGAGCGRTRTSGSVGGQGQQRPWSTRPLDVLSALVGDELVRRQDRLLARRHKQARFRDPDRSRDSFDVAFNKKMNRALIHELATGRFIAQHEDALFLGPPGTGTSHLAQALGRAAIHQGHTVLYDEAYALIEAIADAALDGTRKTLRTTLSTVPLLIIDDLGMRKLPHTAAEDLLEIIMRRDERASTLLTSNRPVDDWGKRLGDTAAGTALLDRLLHHGHVLTCGPRSWRTKIQSDLRTTEATR